MKKDNNKIELKKSKAHIIIELIEYVPDAVLTKSILKKITGNVTLSSFAAGEELSERTSRFDNFIQIIDGTAEVSINDKKFKLKLGEGMVIPAQTRQFFSAKQKFKMISTIIKSGYED